MKAMRGCTPKGPPASAGRHAAGWRLSQRPRAAAYTSGCRTAAGMRRSPRGSCAPHHPLTQPCAHTLKPCHCQSISTIACLYWIKTMQRAFHKILDQGDTLYNMLQGAAMQVAVMSAGRALGEHVHLSRCRRIQQRALHARQCAAPQDGQSPRSPQQQPAGGAPPSAESTRFF